MEKLLEDQRGGSALNTSVRIGNDGMTEIWKGRVALRLTLDEAGFVKDQLCKLIP